MTNQQCRLHVVGLGVAFGLTTAFIMLVYGIVAWKYSFGTPVVDLMSSIYIGYHPTLIGSAIGGLYGFLDGFVCGALIAVFYNLYCSCCHKKEGAETKEG
jgi:hypothetical protein